MKTSQGAQSSTGVQPSVQSTHEVQDNQQSALGPEAPGADSGSHKKVSHDDIELVQNLIERCLLLYMNKAEVVRTLSSRARIEPGFTTLVWQKLEEENPEFFRAYYIRLKLKRQIIFFNHLLEHQHHLLRYPAQVNNLPVGYPTLPQTPMPTPGQPPLDFTVCGQSGYQVVNGIPAPGSFHPVQINSRNDIMMNRGMPESAPAAPLFSAMSPMPEMAVSPASVSSSDPFPFDPSEISGMGMDASTLDANFSSDMGSTTALQLGADCGDGSSRESMRALGHLWDFDLSELTTELTNLGDLGDLENYTGSPFLPLESDILLDTKDDLVEEYFADAIRGPCSQPEEKKS
ncbi:uncharacterized protein [Typha angustifolia]|uniref:uncharacterized protein isoform X1 n=1 Tax=Typha angustifolia TaxID=59011 RepID=UPI003C2C3BA3